MRKIEYPDNNKEQMEKAKKNLVYVGISSIVMLFAGFSSAYIVSMGDSFWIKAPLPPAFWVSTVIIAMSSICIQLAVMFSKKNNIKGVKAAIALTFLLGIGFIYSQVKGYGQLVDNGIHMVANHIIVTDGKYGDYYEVKMDGKFIEVDGNKFLRAGKELTDQEMKSYQDFMAQFIKVSKTKPFKVEGYERFKIYLKNKELLLDGDRLLKPDSTYLQYLDKNRLSYLAINVRDHRGDFFVRGELGKDFKLYYKGKELEYKDREIRMNGTKLSNYLQIKAMESADTSSSYLYIITILHLLHIIVALLYMIKLVIRSFTVGFGNENNISLKMGAIFWHFLGILWLYLLLFLLFIH